jgi:lipoprotein-anchoring transpeptidase ErfK/SrfK
MRTVKTLFCTLAVATLSVSLAHAQGVNQNSQASFYQLPQGMYDQQMLAADRQGVPLPMVVGYRTNSAPGQLLIDHKNQLLYLTLGDARAIEYRIAVGRKGSEAKSNYYRVRGVRIDPTWGDKAALDPSNPLGVRVISLEDLTPGKANAAQESEVALHGRAIKDEGVPGNYMTKPNGERHVSAGCFRMMNADIIHLTSFVQWIKKDAELTVFYRNELAQYIVRNQPQTAVFRP